MQDLQLDVELEIVTALMDNLRLLIEEQRGVLLGVIAVDGADHAQQVTDMGQILKVFRKQGRVGYS